MQATKQFKTRRLAAVPSDLASLPPILARLYAARGVRSAAELSYQLKHLLRPSDFSEQMQLATSRLVKAFRDGEHILIVGDFDSDGATSTALAVSCMRAMGGQYIDYLVPDRVTFGYGLSPELVDFAAEEMPETDLIVTVDNGVSSIDGVRRANELGIEVLVTDHHLQGRELPDAVAIVNPNLHSEDFPSKCLAGVGVVFYVMSALRQQLRENGWFEAQALNEPNLAEYLDLVALGTVADLVPLDSNNRIFVQQGLARIRSGACRPGIAALFQVAGRDPAQAQASDLGFAVGPRLNAAGRLDSMSHGIECLLCESEQTAAVYAEELDALNKERRNIQDDMQVQAERMLSMLNLGDELPQALALFDETWHQGVIGILASRIKEMTHRPVIAFAPGDEVMLKGSARSIEGLHIRDVLDRVASANPGLITKFGGHAMAAGMSLPRANFELFQNAFNQVVNEMADPEIFTPIVLTDGGLSEAELSLDTAHLLERAGPWGQGFPEPLFNDQFELRDRRVLKDKHLKMSLQQLASSLMVEAIVFNVDVNAWPQVGERVELTYKLNINRFRGNETLQLMVQDFRRLEL